MTIDRLQRAVGDQDGLVRLRLERRLRHRRIDHLRPRLHPEIGDLTAGRGCDFGEGLAALDLLERILRPRRQCRRRPARCVAALRLRQAGLPSLVLGRDVSIRYGVRIGDLRRIEREQRRACGIRGRGSPPCSRRSRFAARRRSAPPTGLVASSSTMTKETVALLVLQPVERRHERLSAPRARRRSYRRSARARGRASRRARSRSGSCRHCRGSW